MTDYRTPLPRLFAGFLEAGLNRVLALDPESDQRLLGLHGKCLRVDLEGVAIALFLKFESGYVKVDLDGPEEPDAVISGTPVSLFSMAVPAGAVDWGLPGSGVKISGDAALARDLERLFGKLDPDWHEPVSAVFGETLGYQITSGISQGIEELGKAIGQTIDMAGEWFREESGLSVSKNEIREFGEAVDSISDAVDRLDARIRSFRERQP